MVLKNYHSFLGRMISTTPVSTSLLRIRNLFNDSVVKEIDPVYNNLKLIRNDGKNECLQSNKKSGSTTQHIFFGMCNFIFACSKMC